MATVATIKGKEYRMYKVFHYGNCLYVFWASSERAAKIKTSKFCGNDVLLYKAMGGIRLCDENENEIASYSPFFGEWYKANNISYATI